MLKKIILISVLLLLGAGIFVIPVQSGILLTNEKKDHIHFIPFDGNTLSIGWTHSVELTPWKETYDIHPDGSLSFSSTLYQSYGAGTPDTDGTVELLADGFIQVTGIERTIPYYSLYYIPISEYYLELDSKKYELSRLVPDYTNVQIHDKTFKLYEWLWWHVIEKPKEGIEHE